MAVLSARDQLNNFHVELWKQGYVIIGFQIERPKKRNRTKWSLLEMIKNRASDRT